MAASISKTSVSRLLSMEKPCMFSTFLGGEGTKAAALKALEAGFRRFDTAVHPQNFNGAKLGKALRTGYRKNLVKREDIFFQSKFIPAQKQNWTKKAYVPYSSVRPIEEQVEKSVASSLNHVRADAELDEAPYIDSFLLDLPLLNNQKPFKAWNTLETYFPSRIRQLGVSNVSYSDLGRLYSEAIVKPSIVMNQFNENANENSPLRQFCQRNGINYQVFWALVGKNPLLEIPVVEALASAAKVSPPIALLAFIYDLVDVVLRPTQHVSHDLNQLSKVREWALSNTPDWEARRMEFRTISELKVDTSESDLLDIPKAKEYTPESGLLGTPKVKDALSELD